MNQTNFFSKNAQTSSCKLGRPKKKKKGIGRPKTSHLYAPEHKAHVITAQKFCIASHRDVTAKTVVKYQTSDCEVSKDQTSHHQASKQAVVKNLASDHKVTKHAVVENIQPKSCKLGRPKKKENWKTQDIRFICN